MRALVVLALASCAPSLVWSGRTTDRTHEVKVIRRGDLDYVTVDGVHRGAFRGVAGWSLALANDHVAFAAKVGAKWTVVLDGKAGDTWDAIGHLAFSDSGKLAYIAERDRRWFVVAMGRVGPGFDSILAGTFRWSDDHYAYVGSNAGRVQAVIDGVAGPVFDGISSLTLDRGRHAYAARSVFDAFVVIDGVTGPKYSAVRELTLASGRVAYAASDGTAWRVIVDGEAGPAMAQIARVLVAGPHVAFVGRIDDHDVIALDGEPVAARPRIRSDGVVLSAAGLAYIDGTHVVINDTPGPEYDEVNIPVWSADGRVAYAARRDRSQFIVLDGRELPGGQLVGQPVFSPNGTRLAYATRRDRRWLIVADGREHHFDLVLPDSLVFSRDNKHWAAIAGDLKREELAIVVDGTRRIPIPKHELHSLGAWQDHDPTAALLAWVRAEAERD